MHNVNVRVFWSIVHLFIYNIQITFLTLSEFWLSLAFKTVNQLSVDVSHSDVGETFLIGGQRFSLTIVNFHLGQPKIVHYISGLKDFFFISNGNMSRQRQMTQVGFDVCHTYLFGAHMDYYYFWLLHFALRDEHIEYRNYF